MVYHCVFKKMGAIHGRQDKNRNPDGIFVFNKRAGIRGRRVKLYVCVINEMEGIHGRRLKIRNSDDIFVFNKRAGIRGRRVKVRNPVGMIIINEMKPPWYMCNPQDEGDSWGTA